jgi:hypothetical protein
MRHHFILLAGLKLKLTGKDARWQIAEETETLSSAISYKYFRIVVARLG